MKFISRNVAGYTKVMRIKRAILDDVCSNLDYGSVMTEAVADTAMDVNAMPIIGKVGGVATSAVSAVSHLTKAGMEMTKTALGCDDIPFEEIKEILNERFDELDRRLDRQVEAMQKVTTMISKTLNAVETTRIEMNDGFQKVVNAITDNTVKQKVTDIKTFVEFFNTETDRVNDLSKDDFVSKLSESNNILQLLKDSRTPKMGTLQTAMNAILSNDYAIPKNENDTTAFQALFALFYGCQTYVAIFGFLMKSHAYLANYHYQEGNYDKFNKQIDTLNIVFNDFTASLVRDSSGFIPKVAAVLKKVKSKGFISKVNSNLYKEVSGRSKLIDLLKADIQKMTLPIIKETPKEPTLRFGPPDVKTPLGDWKDGIKVKYAVQYMQNGIYSKLGKWSSPLNVRGKAFPTVKASTGPSGTFRLIFRQINNDTPQLTGILAKSQTEFRDKDRDLYNAAGETDRDLSLELTEKFIEKGSNKNAVFELGRTALHNAAKAGNVKSYNYLIQKGANITKDRKGYTPLHVAAAEGRAMIIGDMLKSKVDPNVGTTEGGFTALHIAAMNNQRNVIDELLKSSETNVNAKDNNGFTALHAAVNKEPGIVNGILKGKDVDVNIKSKAGHTPAHIAAMKGEYNVMRPLKDTNKLDINAKDMNNMTPLHYAAMLGNDDMVKKINAFGNIEPNVAAKTNKWTPLHFAIFFKKTDSALELIGNWKINVKSKATSDVTPLHMAAGTGQDTVVEALLNKNADVNAKTDKGDTPLHLAAINNCKKCAIALVNKGADIKAKNKANKTPLDMATQFNKKIMISFLKSKNGKRSVDYEGNFEMEFKNKIISHAVNAAIGRETPANPMLLLNQKEAKTADLSNLRVDGNATLLLLDVILRKFTDEKYNAFLDSSMPEFEAQVKAFDVTERFEKLLNAISTVPISEKIDLSEVASKVKKALMGDRGSDVTKILCSYAKMIETLKPEDYGKLMQTFHTKASMIPNTMKPMYAEVDSMLNARCN